MSLDFYEDEDPLGELEWAIDDAVTQFLSLHQDSMSPELVADKLGVLADVISLINGKELPKPEELKDSLYTLIKSFGFRVGSQDRAIIDMVVGEYANSDQGGKEDILMKLDRTLRSLTNDVVTTFIDRLVRQYGGDALDKITDCLVMYGMSEKGFSCGFRAIGISGDVAEELGSSLAKIYYDDGTPNAKLIMRDLLNEWYMTVYNESD